MDQCDENDFYLYNFLSALSLYTWLTVMNLDFCWTLRYKKPILIKILFTYCFFNLQINQNVTRLVNYNLLMAAAINNAIRSGRRLKCTSFLDVSSIIVLSSIVAFAEPTRIFYKPTALLVTLLSQCILLHNK